MPRLYISDWLPETPSLSTLKLLVVWGLSMRAVTTALPGLIIANVAGTPELYARRVTVLVPKLETRKLLFDLKRTEEEVLKVRLTLAL
jgi:hypothetical protein